MYDYVGHLERKEFMGMEGFQSFTYGRVAEGLCMTIGFPGCKL